MEDLRGIYLQIAQSSLMFVTHVVHVIHVIHVDRVIHVISYESVQFTSLISNLYTQLPFQLTPLEINAGRVFQGQPSTGGI